MQSHNKVQNNMLTVTVPKLCIYCNALQQLLVRYHPYVGREGAAWPPVLPACVSAHVSQYAWTPGHLDTRTPGHLDTWTP